MLKDMKQSRETQRNRTKPRLLMQKDTNRKQERQHRHHMSKLPMQRVIIQRRMGPELTQKVMTQLLMGKELTQRGSTQHLMERELTQKEETQLHLAIILILRDIMRRPLVMVLMRKGKKLLQVEQHHMPEV